MTYFLNFVTHSVTFDRIKIDTSFFSIGLGEYYKADDDLLFKFGTPYVTFERIKVDTSVFFGK